MLIWRLEKRRGERKWETLLLLNRLNVSCAVEGGNWLMVQLQPLVIISIEIYKVWGRKFVINSDLYQR